MRLFENQSSKGSNNEWYKMTHLVLKRYPGKPFVHTFKEWVIEEVAARPRTSKADQLLFSSTAISCKELTGINKTVTKAP